MKDYNRVIPRDLFNEANLLKCLGKLVLLTDESSLYNFIEYEHIRNEFEIVQDQYSGDIYCINVNFFLKSENSFIELFIPLNSREPWPLYYRLEEDIEGKVFTNKGELTKQFMNDLKYCSNN